MTDSEKVPNQSVSEYYSEDIDVKKYLSVLSDWWREIVLIAFVCSLISVAVLSIYKAMSPPYFAATADVIIARVTSEISLDERVQTVIDGFDNKESVSYRASLLELASSGSIAVAVVDDIGEMLSEEQQVPTTLLNSIEIHTPIAQDGRTSSDIIRITATSDSPERAALIANSWAQQYVDMVNALYGEIPPGIIKSLEVELSDADAAYQVAQAEYEAFIANSETGSLERQIREQQVIKDAIEAGYANALAVLAAEDQLTREEFLVALTSAQRDSALQVFQQQVQARSDELRRLYTARAASLQQLDQAKNLLQQVEASDGASTNSNGVALQLLKAQVFASIAEPILSAEGNLETTVQQVPADIIIGTDNQEVMQAEDLLRDAKALVTTIEEYLTSLDQRISEASQELSSGEGYSYLDVLDASIINNSKHLTQTSQIVDDETITSEYEIAVAKSYENLLESDSLARLSELGPFGEEIVPQESLLYEVEQKIQTLRSKLESENSKDVYLSQKRDLTWNTYDALSKKAAELYMELSAANSQVRTSSLAIPPSTPIEKPSTFYVLVVSFSIGLLFGTLLAYIASFLGYQPLLRRIRGTA